MCSLNDEKILITFDELRELDQADISLIVDKYSALSICEKSSAPPREIYNIWVQKLLKAYDVKEFSHNDWSSILQYFGKVLREFILNLNTANDTFENQVKQWWLDTQELLKCLDTIINTFDTRILCLILTFVMEVIIKTCKFANKGNFKTLCNVQHIVINLTNNYIFKMTITDVEEFENFTKILNSLCDVGCLISSADIKTSVETWRVVAKLGNKFNNCCDNFAISKSENTPENNWYEKAILGIFKELKEILKLYKSSPESANDNLLQINQFYLKLLKVIINSSKGKLKKFPAIKEFIEVYALCHHDLPEHQCSKIDFYINKSLFDIFASIYKEHVMTEAILQHLNCDKDNFKACDLVVDYLKVTIESFKNPLKHTFDLDVLLKLYNSIFEGPLIFIDNSKYTKVLEYFVVLTIVDDSNELHKKLCEYVVDLSWIRAFASMEVLNMYYSYILQQPKTDSGLKCLEYWHNMWNQLNTANDSYRQHIKLIEVLLKNILQNINEAELLQYSYCNKNENIEIILLICGKENEHCLKYLQTNLSRNLKQMQERDMNGWAYREMLNLLEFCALKPQLINNILKEHIFTTFTGLFSLPAAEIYSFQEFFNTCLRFFELQQDKQLNDKLLTHLMQHEQHCSSILSVFLIEFLRKNIPQTSKLLEYLQSSNKLTSTIINLLEYNTSNKQTIDLRIFQDLNKNYQQSSYPERDLEHIKKKPRLDTGNFLNIKFILNDLKTNSQKLLNVERSTFDSQDYELLQEIKNNIEKCLFK